jgi:hypothetical protein
VYKNRRSRQRWIARADGELFIVSWWIGISFLCELYSESNKMGEYGNESMFRDWQSDPKKLGDPIKPIEVSLVLYYALQQTMEQKVS